MASPWKLRPLDYGLFKAFAGGSARVPSDGQLVYYFPEGHAEHAFSPPDFSSLPRSPPVFLCRVTSVSFSAHPESDEVYASITLDPCTSNATNVHASPPPCPEDGGTVVSSFAKVLTPSDANNGGGFSVPRYFADSLFPPLDYNVEPPVQNLPILDVHGNTWEFRHIFRGTPRRHLLTTGWSKFVNRKKLIAGDSVVFSRDLTGQLFVGIRRTNRTFSGLIRFPIPTEMKLEHDETAMDKGGFFRRTGCRISPKSVVEAVRSAVAGRPFEVIYYPKTGWLEFVVAMESVVTAMAVPWEPGVMIRMAVETEESSSAKWLQGTVSCVAVPEHCQWARSPWRMLQVNWDEEGVLHNLKTVNPWEVELVSSNSHYTVMKKLKDLDGVGIHVGQGCTVIPMTGFACTELGSLTSSSSNLNESPFGRQGARHILSSSAYFVPKSTNQLITENTCVIDIWSAKMSKSEVLASPDQSNHQPPVVKIFGNVSCNPTRNSSKGTIQLFGKIIHINQLAETNTSTGFPVSFPQKQLLEGQRKIPAGSL